MSNTPHLGLPMLTGGGTKKHLSRSRKISTAKPMNRPLSQPKHSIDSNALRIIAQFQKMELADTAREREMRKELGLDKETEKLIQEING